MDILVFTAGFTLIALASKQMGTTFQKTGLPLISMFLLTGVVAGPYVLGMISKEAVANLGFVDEISLGFIAFAAGAELYLKELKSKLQTIAWITVGLVIFTFTLSSITFYLISAHIPFMTTMPPVAKAAVAILAGAILVARSPSSAIAIVNELRAKGPFTQTALGVTVIMDVVVIVLFSANSSIADALLTGVRVNLGFVLLLVFEIGGSLIFGFGVSKILLRIIRLPVPPLLKTIFILATGYFVFALSAGIRHYTHNRFVVEFLFEPLLICMVAGFLVSNTSRFRDEFLKILNDIGPVIYTAFFTLTGASLSLDVLAATWQVAVVLFLVRITAVFFGSFVGGSLAGNPARVNSMSWMAYITQAGVGLGLAKDVVVAFPAFGTPFATIIISVIILNQLVGPPLFKLAIKLMKEDHPKSEGNPFGGAKKTIIFGVDGQASALALSLMSQEWEVTLAMNGQAVPAENFQEMEVVHFSRISRDELERIQCHKAGAIVTMLSDEQNYKICEIAYENFGSQTLIARINDRFNTARFQTLGVLIVDPSTAIVGLLDHFVRSPAAASLLMGMHKERNVVDLRIQNPDLSGLALRDFRLPFDLIIMSVRRRGVLFVPHGFTRLEAGDLVTVLGSKKSIAELALRFGVNRKEAMLQMVKKATARELQDEIPVHNEVRKLINVTSPPDRFDVLVAKSQVIDLKKQMDKHAFFKLAAKAMSAPLEVPDGELFHLLCKREDEMTTVLSPGLAVPHVIIEGQDKFSVLLVRCKKGIEFSSSQPLVYAAFVLIGSRDQRNFHLQALSAIARIVMEPGFEKKWMRAKDKHALKQMILSADRQRNV
ncbi:transporter, CPA2 family [Desulfocicer vacuolatum DSM 3385]|uniref:Transporter, CPA2 family n=1 Tax=Desulfocicer vacuolatum DSM 3385 TaxID=1121400 RepID=A0A1W2EDC2_9BACT|nr:cation:proton antiporter [Desulfocicer vacuolatum]SMD07685.1 transporter, CPA2 family [Desulfocicer vacuolatum DSM 3385]